MTRLHSPSFRSFVQSLTLAATLSIVASPYAAAQDPSEDSAPPKTLNQELKDTALQYQQKSSSYLAAGYLSFLVMDGLGCGVASAEYALTAIGFGFGESIPILNGLAGDEPNIERIARQTPLWNQLSRQLAGALLTAWGTEYLMPWRKNKFSDAFVRTHYELQQRFGNEIEICSAKHWAFATLPNAVLYLREMGIPDPDGSRAAMISYPPLRPAGGISLKVLKRR